MAFGKTFLKLIKHIKVSTCHCSGESSMSLGSGESFWVPYTAVSGTKNHEFLFKQFGTAFAK